MSRQTVFYNVIDGPHIFIWSDDFQTEVKVKVNRKVRTECRHDWCTVSRQGHGRWTRGCSKCGALTR